MFRSRFRIFSLLVAAALLVSPPATAIVAPDTTRSARQEQALRQLVARFTTARVYDVANCTRIEGDAKGLVAALELDRRSLSGGLTPALASPTAQKIAAAVYAGQGSTTQSPLCAHVAGPPMMNAAAALAYALHRYGSAWPAATKEAIRHAVEDATWPPAQYLVNLELPVPVAALLVGEAMGRTALWQKGVEQLNTIYDKTMRHGGIEMNSPHYSAHHLPSLLYLLVLRDNRVRNQARILLDYELLVMGHLYVVGGAMGAPQSRDIDGGAADAAMHATLPVLWLLIGDPQASVDLTSAYDSIVVAATDYQAPEVIRSIFLEKGGGGFTFWARHDAQQSAGRTANAVYSLGTGGAQTFPWQAVVLPGGAGMLGVSYGYRLNPQSVASGAYVGSPRTGMGILYQYQPLVAGDTDDTGAAIGGTGLNSDPDDFAGELYNFERMVHERSSISLWDPMPKTDVVRTYRDTRVHIPDLSKLGGETRRVGEWYVGRLGTAYLAYRPLGTVAKVEPRDGGSWTYLRLPGRSGGITELATTSDFPTIDAYAANLASRYVSFWSSPLAAEFDARKANGSTVRIRLEYAPERRVVGGVEQSVNAALDHGLLSSSCVRWDEATRTLTVQRAGYTTVVYDWANPTVRSESTALTAPGEPILNP